MKSIIKLAFLFVCSISFAQTNLLDSSTWVSGTGSVSGFNILGTSNENSRVLGIGPHGLQKVLWENQPADNTGNRRGWITDYVTIDHTKTYRYTSWVKKTNSKDGSIYLILTCKDDLNSNTALNLNGSVNGAPYPFGGDPENLDEWYLLVGYIHHSGYTSTTSIGGGYDTNGIKRLNMDDYKFSNNATRLKLENILWFSTNTNDHLFTYGPTIYEVNGQEPTIQELIDGPGDTQAPTASTLSSTAQTDTSVALSWTAATDDTAVTGYKVYKGGVLETTLGNVLSYQVTGLTASTAYNFTVTALDAAGNESVVSNTLNITTTSASSFDSAYQAILDEATTQGYTLPSTADQNIQNQIIISAKTNGIWASSDLILYFKGSGDKNFKLINWKNPAGVKATEEAFGGVLTWSSTGVKGDGFALINTRFNPSVGGLNYVQNNAGFYAKVSEAYTNGFTLSSGSNISLSTTFLRPRINSTGLAPVFTFPGTGLLGVSRNSATSHIVSIGSVLTTQTHATDIIVSEDISVLGEGSTAVINSYTRFDGEVAYVIIGGDMSDKLSAMETAFDSTSSGDTQAPTASTLSSAVQTDTTVDLSWTAATDDTAVTGYKVYKGGVLETTLGNVLNLSSNRTHSSNCL